MTKRPKKPKGRTLWALIRQLVQESPEAKAALAAYLLDKPSKSPKWTEGHRCRRNNYE